MLGNRHRWGVLQVGLVLLAGCGNEDVDLAPECLEGPATVRAALAEAPDEVRLGGRVAISACFQAAAAPADVQNLGSTLVDTAEALKREVRRAPHSRAAVQLGYLVGAVHRGAGTDGGIHYETGRRIEQELTGVRKDTEEFKRGLAAGERNG
jgi:hypothetical protein